MALKSSGCETTWGGRKVKLCRRQREEEILSTGSGSFLGKFMHEITLKGQEA